MVHCYNFLQFFIVISALSAKSSTADCLSDGKTFHCSSGPTKLSYSDISSLDLSNRNISTLDKELLRHYQHIKHLSLHSNALRSVENLKPLWVLQDLEHLDLSNNSFFFMNLKVFAHNRKLKVLVLNDNPNMLLSPSTAELRHLEELHLRNCGLSELRSSSFQGLRGLRVLDLRWNKIRKLPGNFYEALGGADAISLLGNPILSGKESYWDDEFVRRMTFFATVAALVVIYFVWCRNTVAEYTP